MFSKILGLIFILKINFAFANTLPGIPMDQYLEPAYAEDYCDQEPWLLSDLEVAHFRGKYGLIPARYLYQATQAEKSGDMQLAADNKAAAKIAGRVYHKQMQGSFRYLQSIMNRQQIGMYAQAMWVNVTKPMEVTGASPFLFIQGEKFEMMDDEMKELARQRVYMNTKWMALVINEIPVY